MANSQSDYPFQQKAMACVPDRLGLCICESRTAAGSQGQKDIPTDTRRFINVVLTLVQRLDQR